MNDFSDDIINLRRKTKLNQYKLYLQYIIISACCCLLVIVILYAALLQTKKSVKPMHQVKESYYFAIEHEVESTKDRQINIMRQLKLAAQNAPLNAKAQSITFNCQNLLILDLQTDEILFSRAGLSAAYPASLVKVMTAILAVENIKDLDKEISMDSEMYPEFYAVDASMAGYLAGEKTSPRQLLYGLFLASGAECSTQLALTVTPDLSEFVQLMNNKAKEIGMYQTNFTNVTGLHDDKQITTAYDMAKCLAYAAKFPVLREIMQTQSYAAPVTKEHPEGFAYNNLLFKRFRYVPNREQFQWQILGGKTGYTDVAHQTMVTLIDYRGKKYVIATLNATLRKGQKANPLALDVTTCMEKLLINDLNK